MCPQPRLPACDCVQVCAVQRCLVLPVALLGLFGLPPAHKQPSKPGGAKGSPAGHCHLSRFWAHSGSSQGFFWDYCQPGLELFQRLFLRLTCPVATACHQLGPHVPGPLSHIDDKAAEVLAHLGLPGYQVTGSKGDRHSGGLHGAPSLLPSWGNVVADAADLRPICRTVPACLWQLPSGSWAPGQGPQHSRHPHPLAAMDGITEMIHNAPRGWGTFNFLILLQCPHLS